jgi:hypothetical protein
MNWEDTEQSGRDIKYYTGICLGGLSKIMEILSE